MSPDGTEEVVHNKDQCKVGIKNQLNLTPWCFEKHKLLKVYF